MKSPTRPHYGRIVLAGRELARLQALWANIEQPLRFLPALTDRDPRPSGPAAALPLAPRSRPWAEAA